MNKSRIDRRRFLRCAAGGMGAAVALPALEGMFDSDNAFAQQASIPRYWFTFQPNGYATEAFYPKENRPDAAFEDCGLAGLQPNRENVTLFKNIKNTAEGISKGNDHLVAMASYLACEAIDHDDGNGHVQSVDWFMSQHYQQVAPTRVRQLNLGANVGREGGGGYNTLYKTTISFDDQGRFVGNENNLKKVFDQMFAGFDPAQTQQVVNHRRLQKTKVVDFVLEDLRQLNAGLGVEDKRRVDQYLTNLVEVERGLAFAPDPGAAQCSPGRNPFDENGVKVDRVVEHWGETAKLVALAFQCDMTRVVTYMLGGETADARYSDVGINKGIHGISHNGGGRERELYRDIDAHHASRFNDSVDLFASTPLGAGSLLDASVLHWGTALGDGNIHERENLFALLAGNVGGMRHGRIIDVNNNDRQRTHVLINTVLERMGIPAPGGFGAAGEGEIFDLT